MVNKGGKGIFYEHGRMKNNPSLLSYAQKV